MARISRLLCLAAPLCASAWGTTFYVDRAAGSDQNAGTSPSSAWQTLSHVGHATFSPGDYILLKRGQVWNEQLNISSSGLPEAPITYGAFGSGTAPIIDGAGVAIPAQQGLVNSEAQTSLIIRDLEVRNSAADGIVPYLASGLQLRNCVVHDNQYNGILVFDGNNITIDGSSFYNNSLNVAATYAGIALDGTWPPQSNFTISNNSIHDNVGGEGWANGNGINLGHTGTSIPTLQNVLVVGNDIFRNGNPDQNQSGRGISGSFNGDVTVIRNSVHENASAGIYLGDLNLVLNIVISQNTFRNNSLRQFGGITNGTALAEQNFLYVDDPNITGMGAEVGGGGPWTIRYNVFSFAANTTDTWRAFIRINDPVQDGLLVSDHNSFYSAGPNRWKRSDGTVLSFRQWQSYGFDANGSNPH